MKINKDIRITAEGTKQDIKNEQTGAKFQELVMKQNQKLQTGQLSTLIKNIDDAGKRLGRSQTLKELTKFKSLVKKFVKEAVGYGLELKKDQSWNQFGQGKDLNIVQVIDEKLIELTEEVMNKEKSSLTILNKIGEIKGMLINLYT
ncbi:MAG: YaaR family protein [Bacillus sp. (in: firmicutes)]